MIQVYTGNGKGKSTAAFGLALRASGAGLNVYIAQFVKGRCCSEVKALKKIKNIKLEQFGRSCFVGKAPNKIDIQLALKGFKKVTEVIFKEKFSLVILDEINVAVKLKLVPVASLLKLIESMPKSVELVLTGRCAHPKVLEASDLVSEVRDLKHYYRQGTKARRGIEF
ncbi:MAG: cob(I)yrinic acid a,c-diamide adenosyltransferase [Candidatus Omnitrophota bacterium]